MTLGFDPVLVQFGSLAVRPFGLFALIGLFVAVWLTVRAAERTGIEREAVLKAAAWAVPVGVLSARVVYVLGWWDYYLTRPTEIWQLGIGGLSLWGGLLGGGLVASAALRHDRPRRRRIFDLAVPGVLLAIAIARTGAFLEGAGQGLPSDLPWATQYPSPHAATPDFGVPRHPAQMYEALIALALFALLSRVHTAGLATALFLMLFGGARVALGAVRLDPPFLFGLQIEQLLGLGAIVVGVIIAVRTMRRMQVKLLAKRDCHLCEAALAELRRLQGRYPHQLSVVDITSDATLQQQYGERIPVVQVDGREYDAPLTRAVLERALRGDR